MARLTSIAVPVWLQESKYDAIMTRVMAEVPEVTSDEAPVVIEWVGNRQNQIGGGYLERFEYRSFNDHLWMPTVSVATEDIGRLTQNFLNTGMLQAPFVSNARIAREVYEPAPLSEHRLRERVIAVAPEIETRVMVLDGVLWVRCHGPLLRTLWQDHNSPRPRLTTTMGQDDEAEPDKRLLVFEAHRKREVATFLEEAYGGEPRFRGEDVQVVGPLPQGSMNDDLLHLSVERAIWHFLWEARFVGVSGRLVGGNSPNPGAALHVAEKVLEVREIMGERWPMVDVERSTRSRGALGAHLHGRQVKEAYEILPVLESIIRESDGIFPKSVLRNWQFVQSRMWKHMEARRDVVSDLEGLVI